MDARKRFGYNKPAAGVLRKKFGASKGIQSSF
jgi:hypothetical protein